MPPHSQGTEPRDRVKRLREAHRSYLHVLLFDTDQHSIDARLPGGIGHVVRPVLVILHRCSDWTAWRSGFRKATLTNLLQLVVHYFRM